MFRLTLLASTAIAAVLALALPAFAHGGPEDAEPAFATSCNDGQAVAAGGNGCDSDGKADGYCTFGPDNKIRIKVGQTKKLENPCHVVGQFTCDPYRAPAAKIIEMGKSPASKPVVVRPSGPAEPEKKKDSMHSCDRDFDCVPTTRNGCVPRHMFKDIQDRSNTNVSCRCMKGPVAYGCVPRGSDWEGTLRRMNSR
jgi:hypothetical protein